MGKPLDRTDDVMVCSDCRIWFANGDPTGMGDEAYQRIVVENAFLRLWPQTDKGYWYVLCGDVAEPEPENYGSECCGLCGDRIYGTLYHWAVGFHKEG